MFRTTLTQLVGRCLAIVGIPLLSYGLNLQITEVFFDGTDEWLEITNLDTGNFVGSLTITGASGSPIILSGITLVPGEVIIVGDTLTNMVFPLSGAMIFTGRGLSLTDTNAINITLSDGSNLLDNFVVPVSLVASVNNMYTSFSKARSSGMLVTVATSSGDSSNVTGNWIANPGILVIVTGQATVTGTTTGTTTGITTTGGTTGVTTYGSGVLHISEIHAGSNSCLDEYIIIVASGEYVGNLTIYGLGSSTSSKTIAVNLSTGDQLIVTDNINNMSPGQNIILISAGITLTDGGETLKLIDANNIIIDEVQYIGSAGGKSFFETSQQSGYRQFQTVGDTSVGSVCASVNFTGGNGLCNIVIDSDAHLGSGIHQLTIHIFGQYSGQCQTLYTWSINATIIQTGSCSATINTTLGSNQILFEQYSGTALLCKDSLIYSTHFDTVSYSVNSCLNSTNNSGNGGTNRNCGMRLQTTTPFSLGGSFNMVATYNGTDISNSSSLYTCQWNMGNGQTLTSCNPSYFEYPLAGIYPIILTVLDTNGQICQTSQSINYPGISTSISSGSAVGSCKEAYYKQLYTKRKNRYDDIKYQLGQFDLGINSDGLIYGKKICKLSGSNQMISTGSEIMANSKLDDIVPIITTGGNNFTGELYSSGITIDDYLQISSIVPNPDGKDTDGETITLMLYSGDIGDLTGFYLWYNNKKHRLSGMIVDGSITLTGDFKFPNKASCIELKKANILYDTICYDTPKAGEVFGGSGDIVRQFETSMDIGISGEVEAIVEEKICTNGNGEIIKCKVDRYAKLMERYKKLQLKVQSDKLLCKEKATKTKKRYEIKLDKLQDKYDKNKVKNKISNEKHKIIVANLKIDKQKTLYEMYLYKNYSTVVNDLLTHKRKFVMEHSEIQDYYTLLQSSKKSLKSGQLITLAADIPVRIYNLKKINTQDKKPRSDIALMKQRSSQLAPQLIDRIDTIRLQQLNASYQKKLTTISPKTVIKTTTKPIVKSKKQVSKKKKIGPIFKRPIAATHKEPQATITTPITSNAIIYNRVTVYRYE